MLPPNKMSTTELERVVWKCEQTYLRFPSAYQVVLLLVAYQAALFSKIPNAKRPPSRQSFFFQIENNVLLHAQQSSKSVFLDTQTKYRWRPWHSTNVPETTWMPPMQRFQLLLCRTPTRFRNRKGGRKWMEQYRWKSPYLFSYWSCERRVFVLCNLATGFRNCEY